MSARLIITLPADADTPCRWVVCSSYGDVIASGEGENPPVLPAGLAVTGTIAIMPAEKVHVRQISLPARSERAAQQAAPYALEEYLASPLETQRIVCGPAGSGGARWVAALDKSLAESWQTLLETIATRPVFAISDAMLLEPADGELALAGQPGRVLWRYRAGMADSSGGLPGELGALIIPALVERHQPETVSFAAGQGADGPSLRDITVRHTGPVDLVQAAAGVDLSQLAAMPRLFGAGLAASLDWPGLLRPWRRVAVLACVAAGLALTGLAVEAAWLAGEARRFEEAGRTAFAAAFPDIRRIVNPRVQLAQRLRELEVMEAGDDRFLQLAGALAGVTQDMAGIEIVAVRFEAQDGALSVSARYGGFADFEALRSAGEAAGLDIADAGARQGADGVSGEFVVRWQP